MDFRKRMKIILYASVAGIIIGGVLFVCALAFLEGEKGAIVMLIAMAIIAPGMFALNHYVPRIERKGGVDKYVTDALDERNVMLKTKARSITFSICFPIIWIAFLLMYIVYHEFMGNFVGLLALISLAMTLIYEITYFILKRKY